MALKIMDVSKSSDEPKENNKNKVILSDNEFLNPLYSSVKNFGKNKIDKNNLYSIHKRVLIFCMSSIYNNEAEAEKIFDKILTKEIIEKIKKYFTLKQCHCHILKNEQQFNRAIKIEKNVLDPFNNGNIILENEEIVLPLLIFKENDVDLIVQLYGSGNFISDVVPLIELNRYLNNDYNRSYYQLSNIIKSIKESNYWSISKNCQINMTNNFNKRTLKEKSYDLKIFTNNKNKLEKNDESKLEKNDESKLEKDKNNNKNNGDYNFKYMNKNSYIDIANAIKSQPERSYFATIDNDDLGLTKGQVKALFSTLTNEKEMYDIFNTILISKKLCHLVFNYEVLSKMNKIINKYLPLYKILIGYAWTAFYSEECLFKTKTTNKNRYIFDIQTANLLPLFPYCQDDIFQNPYVIFPVSESSANIKNNCMSLGPILEKNPIKITNLERFKWKFNIFTTGDPTKNIFDNLDWGNRFAISGSCIPAFVQETSPLFDLIEDKNIDEHKNWEMFFKTYYSNSDIDLMCNDRSIFDFIDGVNHVKNVIETNIGQPVKAHAIKSTRLFVHEKYIDIVFDNMKKELGIESLTKEFVKKELEKSNENNSLNPVLKEYFYKIYVNGKTTYNTRSRLKLKNVSELHETYFSLIDPKELVIDYITYDLSQAKNREADNEIYFYVNDLIDVKVEDEKNVLILKISESLKFKLESDKLLKCVEIFRTKSEDFFSVVARFHLPCVRAYYNGETVYLTPSCITANMTGINIDYKYFAGKKANAISILQKYRHRGFSTLLNKNELEYMKFNYENDNNLKALFDDGQMFGFKDINHKIFRQTIKEPINNVNYNSIVTIEDLEKYYKNKLNINLRDLPINILKYKTINNSGYLNKLPKWVIDACYDMY